MNPIILFGLNIDLPININNTVCAYSYFLMEAQNALYYTTIQA